MKQKIIFLHPELCVGGAEKVLLNLLKAIDKSKYEITLLLRNHGAWDKEIPSGIELIYLFEKNPTKGKIKARIYKYLMIFFPTLIYQLLGSSSSFDIAIAYHEPMIWYLSCVKAKRHISWVHSDYSVRNYSPEVKTMRNRNSWLAKLIEKKRRQVIQSFDDIVFVAKTCIPSYVEFNKVNIEKCVVIHNLNNEQEVIDMANESIEDDSWNDYKGVHLLIVGRIHHEKAMFRLIPLMKHVKEHCINAKMYIVGDGNERLNLEKLIEESELQEYFCILGFQSNPYKYIKNAKLLLCCSPSEAYCTTTKEALLLETPFVTTLCSGMEEQIGGTNAGVIVPQGDDTLFPMVKKILFDKEFYKNMKMDAHKRHIALSDNVSLHEFYEFIENNNKQYD